MTQVYFVRHAQPDKRHREDRTRPLTPLGLSDTKAVTALLLDKGIEAIYSSPYKRSHDTILDFASSVNLPIQTDERLRERKARPVDDTKEYVRRRWADFSFAEPDGENLGSVQARNLAALRAILQANPGKSLALATHGTALSTILHHYNPGFGCEGFLRIWYCMPYVVRADFEGERLVGLEELLMLQRGY